MESDGDHASVSVERSLEGMCAVLTDWKTLCNRIQGALSIPKGFCLDAPRSLELRLLSYIDLVNGDEKVPWDRHVTTTLRPELTLF